MYLTCFDRKQKNCNNLFEVYAKSRKRKRCRTHLDSLKTVQQLEGKFCLIPGEKLCRKCWMHTKNILHCHNSPTSSSLLEDATKFSESLSAENNSSLLDDSLAVCGVSPFNSSKKLKCQKLFHANKKIEKITQKLEKTFSTKGVNIATCSPPPATRANDEKDFDQLELKLNSCQQLP